MNLLVYGSIENGPPGNRTPKLVINTQHHCQPVLGQKIEMLSYVPSTSLRNLGLPRIGSHIGSTRSRPGEIFEGTDNSVSI